MSVAQVWNRNLLSQSQKHVVRWRWDNQVNNCVPVQNTFNAELLSVSHVATSKHKFEVFVFVVVASTLIITGIH